MEDYKRDFFVSRIRAGYIPIKIDGKRILIHAANKDILLESSEVYKEEFERALEEELLTDDDIFTFLIINDLWSEKKEQEYQNILPKHIEYWKKELFQSSLKTKTRQKIRKYLQAAKDEYARLGSIRHDYDYVTAQGYASFTKYTFIVSECATLNGEKVDWNETNLNMVMHEYYKSMISAENIRMLSRTSPWSALWPTLKVNGRVFENTNLTEEQQVLISWSIMYDKIHEAPECPSDYVIQDDDMLDGWLILQREKREKESNQQEAEGAISDKLQNCDQVFIPVETEEDARKVDDLNSPHTRELKRRRFEQMEQEGKVKQQAFKDVQLDRSRQMQQAYTQNLKGG